MTLTASRRLNRESFVRWAAEAMSGSPRVPPHAGPAAHGTGDVTLIWPASRPDARPVITVNESELQELYAFVSTYIPTAQPFTAFFRILPLGVVDELAASTAPLVGDVRIARLVAGASLAEAWFVASKQSDRRSNALPLLRSSHSMAMGQSVLCRYGADTLQWVEKEWLNIHHGEAAPISDSNGGSVAWRIVLAAITSSVSMRDQSDKIIAQFLKDALDSGSVRADMLREVSALVGDELDLASFLTSNREERISRFNSAIMDFKRKGERSPRTEFLAGLMLALAGNGTFEMIRSARELIGWLDGAVVWFGICAALFEEGNVLSYANGAGRRAVRDLLRKSDPFDAPDCDIASTELRFMKKENADLAQICAGASDELQIEIVPNVSTWARNAGTGASALHNAEREAVLRSMDEISYLAQRTRRQLMSAGGADDHGGGPQKSKRSGRSR